MAEPLGDRVVKQIMAGKLDDRVADITAAIGQRVQSGTLEVRWEVTFDGYVVAEDDLLLDECFLFERECGVSWARIDPVVSATHLRGVLLAVAQCRMGLDKDAAEAKVRTLKAVEMSRCIRQYVVTEGNEDVPATEGSAPLVSPGSTTG